MSATEQRAPVDELVRKIIAAAAHVPPEELTPQTKVAGILDSINLLTILSHVSCLYDIDVTADETLALLEASSLSDVIALVSRIAAKSSVAQ